MYLAVVTVMYRPEGLSSSSPTRALLLSIQFSLGWKQLTPREEEKNQQQKMVKEQERKRKKYTKKKRGTRGKRGEVAATV